MYPRTSTAASRGVPVPGIGLVPRPSPLVPPRALTLVEMLVGLAITLVMMAAVVNLFANIGASVKIRRATMEMSAELRMARATLFNDLAGATCRALPWQRPDEDPGYIEIVEGLYEDGVPSELIAVGGMDYATSQVPSSQIPAAGNITDARALGDYDDILALTVRNESTPFKGRAGDQSLESPVAEVIWYAVENPQDGSLGEPGMRTVYRRVLLVAPWYPIPSDAPTAAVDFFQDYDISAHYDANLSRWVPNTLGDLTKRENRFAHYSVFPHYFPYEFVLLISVQQSDAAGPGTSLAPLTGDRQGEDLMLSNVLTFDLRVFDPGAPLFDYGGTIIEPTVDAVLNLGIYSGVLVGFGAYVDLGWDNNSAAGTNIPDYDPNDFLAANPTMPFPQFQQERMVGWHPRNPTASRGNPAVYDTWSFHYEHDGIDQDAGQDNGAGVDQGTNGLDDAVPYPTGTSPAARDGVDDIMERETSPPYPVPLRGMQVTLKIYDPDTRQIRQATVTRNFVPQ